MSACCLTHTELVLVELESTEVAAVLADAARTIDSAGGLEETLHAIVVAARTAVPGFEHAGISLTHTDGRIETLAATDELVRQLDRLQGAVGEGPCVDSIHEGAVVVVEHAYHEQRWPRYMPEAAQAGVQAQVALSLHTEHRTVAALNLYSTESPRVDPEAPRIAELFASHAAIALRRVRREEQLQDAMATRKVIGQAIGLTMERYQLDEERAFHYLVRASQTRNVKLREVAQEMVDSCNQRYSSGGGAE